MVFPLQCKLSLNRNDFLPHEPVVSLAPLPLTTETQQYLNLSLEIFFLRLFCMSFSISTYLDIVAAISWTCSFARRSTVTILRVVEPVDKLCKTLFHVSVNIRLKSRYSNQLWSCATFLWLYTSNTVVYYWIDWIGHVCLSALPTLQYRLICTVQFVTDSIDNKLRT